MSPLAWLLNVTYAALLVCLSPVIVYRMWVHGKYRDGWSQKLFGRLPRHDSGRPCVWFHAVSVGEVLQLQRIVRELTAIRPDCDVLITTTTHTGLAVAREKFSEHEVSYFPLDFSWAVRRAIRRVEPAAIVLVELELWPNFILEAHRQQIPLALVNGRISERSFRGYRRIRPLMRRLLRCFDVLAVQSETYGRRLVELGADPERIKVTGSVKFDQVASDRDNAKTRELRAAFGIGDGERVFVAGSTHAPEEQLALETYLRLRDEFPGLRLVIVPRHQERFDEVARLVQSRGVPLLRRSRTLGTATGTPGASRSPARERPVLLLDTLGELSACWGMAEIAFVGGSLNRRGGQNMIEPAAYGAAVLFGPNTHNFRDVVELLLAGDAARVVADGTELTNTVRLLLADPEQSRQLGRRAQQIVLAQHGATEQTVRSIERMLTAPASDVSHRAA